MYHVQNCSPKLQFMQFELVRPVYNLKRTSLIIQELQTEYKSFKTAVLQLVQTIDNPAY